MSRLPLVVALLGCAMALAACGSASIEPGGSSAARGHATKKAGLRRGAAPAAAKGGYYAERFRQTWPGCTENLEPQECEAEYQRILRMDEDPSLYEIARCKASLDWCLAMLPTGSGGGPAGYG